MTAIEFRVGDRVRVKRDPKLDRTYTEEGRAKRVWRDGWSGIVCDSSDRHGLCFGVRFDHVWLGLPFRKLLSRLPDSVRRKLAQAWFDSDELELVTDGATC